MLLLDQHHYDDVGANNDDADEHKNVDKWRSLWFLFFLKSGQEVFKI